MSSEGQVIEYRDGQLVVPDNPRIPFIEGDGIGPDIWRATRTVLDAAVETSYGGQKKISWTEVLAGEKAYDETGEWLPDKTLDEIRAHHVSIKGPLTTPVGGGIRSLNVAIRQRLDLYACVRPVRWVEGMGAPVKHPEKLDIVIFRENSEDVYSGIEFAAGTDESKRLASFLSNELGVPRDLGDFGLGVKPISRAGTHRLMAMAVEYAIAHDKRSVTIVHKGNIMKFTEGAFREWAYEVAKERYSGQIVLESELGNDDPGDKIVVKDRIADAMFQQLLLRPDEYDVVATMNLNGDYISDAAVAQVGGLGFAPGANMSREVACFEATHGTAPKYAGQDKVNPGSLILSGVMMLEHMGWQEAADRIKKALPEAVKGGRVTYDVARQMPGATTVKCSEFAEEIVARL
jgi:isocitrate dehydrogenase